MLWESWYEGIKQLIGINPARIVWKRYPAAANSRGVMVEDATATPEIKKAVVRISHEAGGVQEAAAAASGLTTDFGMYMIMLPEVDVRTEEIITASTGAVRKWRVGVIDDLCVEGRVYARRAALVRADG